MKPTVLIILLLTIISCKNQKTETLPDNVVGTKNPSSNLRIQRDSLHIITPAIEVYRSVDNKGGADYNAAISIRNLVIETLGEDLTKDDFFEIPQFSSNYSKYNTEAFLGRALFNKNWIVEVPKNILVNDVKYTVLTCIVVRYGDKKNGSGMMIMATINNEKGIIENVERRNINKSAMNPKVLKSHLDILLSKLTLAP